ncbi:hypothetical protein N2152v2_003220 [Parachlorella kessleri]
MRSTRRGALALLGTWLLFTSVLGFSTRSAPLTIWGPKPLLANKAHFETLAAAEVLGELAGLAAGAAPSPTSPLASLLQEDLPLESLRPKAVVVFVGAQQAAAVQLQALTTPPGSWVQLPNAVHQGDSSPVFKGLQRAAGAGSVNLQVLGSCTGAPAVVPATPEALKQHLQLAGKEPTVVVVCAEGGAVDEAQLLAETQAAVAALTDDYVMVYTTGGARAASEAQQRRRLLQWDNNYSKNSTCDQRCQIQVKYLEGFIVLVTVALALGVGFCCMHIINTPTRFETPKDQRAGAHHD